MNNKIITIEDSDTFNESERLEKEWIDAQKECEKLLAQGLGDTEKFSTAYDDFIKKLQRWRNFRDENRDVLFAHPKK